MEILHFLIVILTVCCCYVHISDAATLRFNTDSNFSPYNTYNVEMDTSSEGDLVYSDYSSKQQESRERLYRQLRQYGVPSDVAQMYVPRGLTVGELLGKGTTKPHHSSADDTDDDDGSNSTFDPWSVVWYIGSFGGLIAFFLVISCSEWCCLRSRSAATLAGATTASTSRTPRCPPHATRGAGTPTTTTIACDTPPPSYHLFAPPSYDDTIVLDEKLNESNEKNGFDVFVVGVHSVPEVLPPSPPPPHYTEIHLNTS